jgi:hypothetical protein
VSFWIYSEIGGHYICLSLCAGYDAFVYTKYTRLIEIVKCFGMEMDIEKAKVMRISRQPSPVQMTDQKQLKYLKFSNRLVSMITNNAS